MTTPNTVIENTAIETTIKEKLLFQFKDSTNINKLLDIFASELQELESTAVIPLLYDRTVNSAGTAELNNIGDIIGVPRRGLTDSQYRAVLKITGLKRNNRGTVNDVITILAFAVGDDQVIYSKGLNYEVDIALTFCSNQDLVLVAADPPFGMLNNPQALGYSTAASLDQGKMSALQSTGGVNSQFLIDEILSILPVVTAIKIIDKPTTFFGFSGNPFATGYAAQGQTGGGQMSILVFINRS
jgi:hypothetical protein